MCLAKNTENETFVKDTIMINSQGEKILGVTVDNKNDFQQSHQIIMYKNFSKISVLTRISNQPNDSEKKPF